MKQASSTEGASLTDRERNQVIMRLIAEHVADFENWLFWEDLPELGEYEFDRLVSDMAIEADAMRARANEADRLMGIDSRFILGQLR